MKPIKQLKAEHLSLRQQLAEIGEFRPGTLNEVYKKCGRSGCRCEFDDQARHPGWTLTRKVKAKTVTRGVPTHALEQTQRQLAEYDRFRELVHQFTELNETLCDQRIKQQRSEKKTSHQRISKHSRSRSPPKRPEKC